MAGGSTEIVTTLVMLLASFRALPMLGWAEEEKAYFFDVPEFNPSVKGLVTTDDAVVRDGFVSLTSSDEGMKFCTKLVCLGKVFYSPSAKVPDAGGISFHTKFTFTMTKSRDGQVTGDGFVFFIGQHPYFNQGQPNGMFGLFSRIPALAGENLFFGIEFDTMKNVDLNDEDDNHVGVDINSAISAQVAAASLVNVLLNDGKKIVAWIDYDKAQNLVEARISYDEPGVLKPTEPLLSYTYDLNSMKITELWVGFSSSSNFGFEQLHQIYEWEFNANFEATATNETITSSGKLAANVVGGVITLGVVWFGIVRFTDFGKEQHARCMKHIPVTLTNYLMLKLFKGKGNGEEVEEGDDEEAGEAAEGDSDGGDDSDNSGDDSG